MRKEELRRLKRINATGKMKRMAENNNKKMKYSGKYWTDYLSKNTEYDIMVRCQTRGKYLMICVFEPKRVAAGEITPLYEIYCNPEGDEYITRILSKGKEIKWSGAMIENVGDMDEVMANASWYDKAEQRIWQNPEGMETIRRFLNTREKGLFGLLEWQHSVRKKRIEEAEKREQAPWDADMALIPKIPPSFNGWMKKEAVSEYFIFFEYSRKGAKEGYCSHCRKMVPVKRPMHNKEGRCSKCGVQIRYKSSGKIRTLETKEYTGQIIQKIKGGIVIRGFRQKQWYINRDYKKPKSYIHEYERILLLDNNTIKRYEYGMYKQKKHRFILDKGYIPVRGTYYAGLTTKLYKRNLKRIKNTVLKNSAIDLWDMLPTSVANYLAIEHGNPAVEKLARLGMFNLAEEFIRKPYESGLLNEDATKLTRMLKIDASRLKRLKAIDGGIAHLKWYQYEKAVNTIWPDDMIRDFGNCYFKTISEFDFLPLPLSYIKIWNYMKKQSEISGEGMARVEGTWKDYINMAQKAKMDVKNDMICRPKNLKAAHQSVIMILQREQMEKEAEELEKEWPKVNGNLPKLKKFEYTDGKYSIVAPESILDIVEEGTILLHCVHTCDYYFDRIQQDESYPFFLRKAGYEDIPWYTLEVEPNGNILQKRTTGDNQNKDIDDAVRFLKKWQKVFVKRMSAEEKELGIKAEQVRLARYAKLREDGNKIWHGRLAGQLLADVLEEDFMAAVM